MTDITQVTAAETEEQLKGTTYRLAPLNFLDFGRLVQHLRDQLIASAAATLPQVTRNSDKNVVMREAFASAKRINFVEGVDLSPEVEAYITSPDGAIRLIHLSLAKHHPDLSINDVAELVDVRNLQHLVQKVMYISGFADASEAPEQTGGAAKPQGPKSGEAAIG